MKSKIEKNLKNFFLIILIVLIGMIFYKYIDKSQNKNIATYTEKSYDIKENELVEEENNFEEEKMKSEEEERIESIEIMAIGDLLMHIDIVQAMYDWNNDTYNFDYNFELIKEYLGEADLTIANLETTLAGEESGFTGYPCFNTPDELADSIKKAGVNIVSNISNHSLDKGKDGFLRTRKVLKEKGFEVIGTRDREDESRYIIKENVEKVELLPYHLLGISKYETMGIKYRLEGVPAMDKEKCKELYKFL